MKSLGRNWSGIETSSDPEKAMLDCGTTTRGLPRGGYNICWGCI